VVFRSSAAMRARLAGTSKKTPHEFEAFVKFDVAAFQVFEDHLLSVIGGS
jgi:hypothetical protein